MQSSKIDFFGKYNELIQTALQSSADFPSRLCDFIIKEFELEAAAFFKVNNSNSLELIGKSITAKKSLSNEILVTCPNCKNPVSYTHLRAHETVLDLVCRLLLEKKKKKITKKKKQKKQNKKHKKKHTTTEKLQRQQATQ